MERRGDGIVYVATGEPSRTEAIRSIRSVRRHSPGLPIAVFTDADGRGGLLEELADTVTTIDAPHFSYREKIAPLLQRPYARTLFLDADTVVRRPVEPLLEMCAAFDVSATHDTWRAGLPVDAPDAFVEPNTGVLVLGDRPAVDVLIRTWDAAYEVMSSHQSALLDVAAQQPIFHAPGTPPPEFHDQPPFRFVVWNAIVAGEIRFGTLPAEANLRLWGATSLAAGAMPWIVHSHADDVEDSAAALERNPHARVWLTGLSGGMGGRLRDEVVVGGTFGTAAERTLTAVDAARDLARRAGGKARDAIARFR